MIEPTLQNRSLQHSSVVKQFDVLLYKSTVNLSMIGSNAVMAERVGCKLNLSNTGVTLSNKIQTFQAVLFETYDKYDT